MNITGKKRGREQQWGEPCLSVLFIPFEANGQHLRTAGRTGAKGHRKSVGSSSMLDAYRGEVTLKEPNTPTLTKREIHTHMPLIMSGVTKQLQRPDDVVMKHLSTTKCPRQQSRLEKIIQRKNPMIIFLSEKPKVSGDPSTNNFADSYTLEDGTEYKLMCSNTATRNVQKISAYRRSDLDAGLFECRAEKRTNEIFNKQEHLLIITYKTQWDSVTVVGVHLTSKNTGANKSQLIVALPMFKAYCKSENIDVAIGDFNLDTREEEGGHVGAVPNQDRFVHDLKNKTTHHLYMEQPSSANAERHYMGILIINRDKVKLRGVDSTGLKGSSLSKWVNINGDKVMQCFSDHPPTFCNLGFSTQWKPWSA